MSGLALKIDTPLGYQIGLTQFKPETCNTVSIVISSATGVLQKYYSKFAQHFATLGYTTYTFDYCGIGLSNSETKQLKHNKVSLSDWGSNDQASVIKFAKDQKPDNLVILITHSIGGQIVSFNSNHHLIDGLITVASQSGYWKHWKGFQRFKMYIFWNVLIPFTTPLFGYFPAKLMGLFENLPKHMAYQWRRWGKQPEYMLSEFKKEDTFFNSFSCPMLALSFPKDEFAPKSSVDWLANQFDHVSLERKHIIPQEYNIPTIGHFGFFRETFKESLWQMAHDWILKNYK